MSQHKTLKINSTLSNKELIDSLNITQYVDEAIVASTPRTQEKELEIEFFNLNRYVSDAELEKEFESRGLLAIDPYSLALWYKDNYEEYRYLATHWKDGEGKWCYIAFSRWDDGERNVHVLRFGDRWDGFWWFAGVRKPSALSEPVSSELPNELILNGIKYIKSDDK